jgi:hypothetical protein
MAVTGWSQTFLLSTRLSVVFSLQATWIRNMLLNAIVQRSGTQFSKSTANFVYAHPSISLLTDFVLTAASGQVDTAAGSKEARIRMMDDMVATYTANLSSPSTSQRPSGQVLLITGTTGGLGCHLLQNAYENPSITRIYALNRKQTPSLADRQQQVLREHGLDERIAQSKKVLLLEGDLTAPFFGLPENVFNDVRLFILFFSC